MYPASIPPAPAADAPPRPGAAAWRAVVATVAVILALACMAGQRRLGAVRREVSEVGIGRTAGGASTAGEEAGGERLEAAESDLLAGSEHEPDAERLRLAAARGALVAEIARGAELATLAQRAAAPTGDAAAHAEAVREADRARLASADRLAGAARLARQALAARPASWEAAMVLGAAIYLGDLERRDPRWIRQAQRWRLPLEAATRLAPREPEPVRFLASAYLDLWPLLSPERREAARPVLRQALSDPIGFDALVETWLAAAGDSPTAFALVPDEPFAWERLEQIFARRRDWEGLVAARRRWDGALRTAIANDLAEAAGRLATGDANGARALYLSAAKRIRPDRRYAALLSEALTRCPAGPIDHDLAQRLLPQLAWLLDTCEYGGCAIEPALIARLARLTDAPPAWQARAALLAGETDDLRRLERQGDLAGFASGATPSASGAATIGEAEDWIPYLVLTAHLAASAGRADEARAALAALPPAARSGPLYWRASAEAATAAGDSTTAARAAAELSRLAATAWSADTWQWRHDKARLVLDAARPAAAFDVTVVAVPAAGGVCEVRLDGSLLGPFLPSPGRVLPLAPLAPFSTPPAAGAGLTARLAAGPHLIEWLDLDLAPGRTTPGAVSLGE